MRAEIAVCEPLDQYTQSRMLQPADHIVTVSALHAAPSARRSAISLRVQECELRSEPAMGRL